VREKESAQGLSEKKRIKGGEGGRKNHLLTGDSLGPTRGRRGSFSGAGERKRGKARPEEIRSCRKKYSLRYFGKWREEAHPNKRWGHFFEKKSLIR